MFKIIFILLALLFSYKIIKNNGIQRMCWFIVGILFFHQGIILVSVPIDFSFPRIITIAFLISCLKSEGIRGWGSFPLKKTLFIFFLCLLVVGMFDGRLSLFQKIYRPFVYFFDNVLILILSFFSIKEEDDWKRLSKVLYISIIIICGYGLINYFVGFNHYSDIISRFSNWTDTSSNINIGTNRVRISSFSDNPIFYGYLMAIFAIFFLTDYLIESKNKKKLIRLIFIEILILTNMYLTNSRTPYMVFVIGLFFTLFFLHSTKGRIKSFIIAFILGFFIVNIPAVQDGIRKVSDIFAEEQSDEIGGSSIEMRLEQLEASMEVFDDNIYTGNGFRYIVEDLGYDPIENEADDSFYGFESYLFELLIEQGIIGLLGGTILFSSLIFYLFKQRKLSVKSRKIAGLSLTLIFCVLFFGLATGRLSSWPITFCLLGVSLKRLSFHISLENESKTLNYAE